MHQQYLQNYEMIMKVFPKGLFFKCEMMRMHSLPCFFICTDKRSMYYHIDQICCCHAEVMEIKVELNIHSSI